MRILFLGAGGVGGYFGGRLTQHGADVTFLVREGRASQLADGLRIESPNGDATIPVKTLLAGEQADPFDIIILTSKAYGLDGALDAIAPHVREGTVVMPLLNGLAHLEKIDARFQDATVWSGVARIPAELTPEGVVKHNGRLAGITVGPRPGQGATIPLVDKLVTALAEAGITADRSDAPIQALWTKWVMLCALAAGGCLLRGTIGEIARTDHGADVLVSLLEECALVAVAEGYGLTDAELEDNRAWFSDRSGSMSPSMLHDLRSGNPTEADHVIGDMIRRAASHGIETPYLKIALTHLQVYEASRT
ncbi:MAG: 2-dehydropantoate 2-reductase [Pseudomonadota bacterium]